MHGSDVVGNIIFITPSINYMTVCELVHLDILKPQNSRSRSHLICGDTHVLWTNFWFKLTTSKPLKLVIAELVKEIVLFFFINL